MKKFKCSVFWLHLFTHNFSPSAVDDVGDPENILHPALPFHHPLLPHPPVHLPHHLPHPPRTTTKTPGSRRASNRARHRAVGSRSRTPCSGSSATIAMPGTIWTACRTTATETRCCSTRTRTSTAAAAEADTTEARITQLRNKPNMLKEIVLLQSDAWGIGRCASWLSHRETLCNDGRNK